MSSTLLLARIAFVFWIMGFSLACLDLANIARMEGRIQDSITGYFLSLFFTGLSIWVVYHTLKDLKNKKRVKRDFNFIFFKFLLIQDSTVFYIASRKAILLLPFLLSVTLIVLFTILTFKFHLFALFYIISPSDSFYLKLLGAFYIYNFFCVAIYFTGYLITGEMLQRMFGKAKKNIFKDMLFNYFYAIPYFLILTLLWIVFVLLGGKRENYSSINIGASLRSLALYSLFKAFQYYTFLNLARISFSDRGVKIGSKESKTLFKENIMQLLQIFIRAGMFLAIFAGLAFSIYGWNSILGFLNYSDLLNYWPLLAVIAFILFLVGLFSEQMAILLYYIKTYHPSNSFNKIGLHLDPLYFPFSSPKKD